MKTINRILILSIVIGNVSFLRAQTTENAVTTTVPSAESAWTASLKSEVSSNLESAKNIGGALTENQFRLAYKFNDQAQLGLLFGGKYNLASENQVQSEQHMVNSDTAMAGIYVVPDVLGADKIEVDGRFYMPTSEASKLARQNYQVRADIKLPYSMGSQRSTSLLVSPRFTDYDAAAEKMEVLSQLRLAQGKNIMPYVALNHRLKMMGQAAGMTRTEEGMGPEVGLEMLPHKMVKLSLLVAQERNTLTPGAAKVRTRYSVFDTKETKYLLGAQIKI